MIFRAAGAATLSVPKSSLQNAGVGITGAFVLWVACGDTAVLTETLALSIAHPSTAAADHTDKFKGSAALIKFDPPLPVVFRDANDTIEFSHTGTAATSWIEACVEGY